MTVPDPEERDRHDAVPRDRFEDDRLGDDRVNGDPVKDTDAAFASIVAGWWTEPSGRPWPAAEDRAETDRLTQNEQDQQNQPGRDQQPRSTPGQPRPEDPDEDHFEPPEPPPLPVPRPRTLGGMLLVGGGIVLLVYPGLLAFSTRTGMLLGLLCVAAGIAWLVLGLRTGPPTEGWDDGARV